MRVGLIQNTRLMAVLLALIVVAGMSAYVNLPRLEDPAITNRLAYVVTDFPGASAERVESLVTDPIEAALREIAEIKTLNSNSRRGISAIAVELDDKVKDADAVWSLVRDKLSDAAPGQVRTAVTN